MIINAIGSQNVILLLSILLTITSCPSVTVILVWNSRFGLDITCHRILSVSNVFSPQYFDIVRWVFWPVKPITITITIQSFTLQQIVLRGIMQCCRLVGTDEFSAWIGTVGDWCAVSVGRVEVRSRQQEPSRCTKFCNSNGVRQEGAFPYHVTSLWAQSYIRDLIYLMI